MCWADDCFGELYHKGHLHSQITVWFRQIKSEGLLSMAHLTGTVENADIMFSWRIAEKADDGSGAYMKAIV